MKSYFHAIAPFLRSLTTLNSGEVPGDRPGICANPARAMAFLTGSTASASAAIVAVHSRLKSRCTVRRQVSAPFRMPIAVMSNDVRSVLRNSDGNGESGRGIDGGWRVLRSEVERCRRRGVSIKTVPLSFASATTANVVAAWLLSWLSPVATGLPLPSNASARASRNEAGPALDIASVPVRWHPDRRRQRRSC